MATLGRSKPSTDARSAGRSYLTTSSFNTSFYNYTTDIDYTTGITNGGLSTLSSATLLNCPKGRILRETGRKLYPGVNPGISSLMVSVYDENTMYNGFIDPNSPLYTVFNTDKASFIPNNNYLGSPVYTKGSVEALNGVATNLLSLPASTLVYTSQTTMPPVMGTVRLTSGNCVVSTAACTSRSLVFVSYNGFLVNPGFLNTINVGSGSFQITSSSATDTSFVNWFLVQPY
jgi:hypothetical protein